MRQKQSIFSLFLLSPSSRRAWIEIKELPPVIDHRLSPSSWRAWIEMRISLMTNQTKYVALLVEGVGRNLDVHPDAAIGAVALLTEGVDRNWSQSVIQTPSRSSPSSRRAWIEIHISREDVRPFRVALLTEGVDRNRQAVLYSIVW